MPLFMFMAGTTIPYSLSKYRDGAEKKALYWRIGRRVLLLWILGMIVQGNLLALDPQRIYLFTNTLQAIAVGWLFSALIFLHTNWRTQIGIAIGLLITFWAAMEFVTIGNYGGGDYTPHGNLAEGIDMLLLGRFRDTATIINGEVVVKASYTYTWILSSLNFVVTVLTGVFAGEILKSQIKEFYGFDRLQNIIISTDRICKINFLDTFKSGDKYNRAFAVIPYSSAQVDRYFPKDFSQKQV